MAPSEEPVLWLWAFSAWASKVNAYLALRKIPHKRCIQPITLPRPDLAAFGIKYRRIPLLSVGRDFYCDTLLILEKLEEWYPTSEEHPAINAQNPTDRALERLFEKWTDVVVFQAAAKCITTDADLMKDPEFQKDREALWGRAWDKETQDALRPAGLADMRANFAFLEELLGDGRKWLLGDDGPKVVDIHACWIFDWLFQIPGCYDDQFFNKETYPKTFAWRERYRAAIDAAIEAAPKAPELNGPDAVAQVLKSGFNEPEDKLKVESDPLTFKQGDEIEMYPKDTGYDRKDRGRLIGLNTREVVIQSVSQQDGREMHIHYPRWNFEIKKV